MSRPTVTGDLPKGHALRLVLQKMKGRILFRWRSLLNRDHPASEDPLLAFIECLSAFLENPSAQRSNADLAILIRNHLATRSIDAEYNIKDIIREYEMFRKSIFDVVECEWQLSIADRERIIDFVSTCMAEGATELAKLAGAREQKVRDELKETAELFQAIFDLAASGKSVVDLKTGRFLKVNRKLCEMVGYSETELLNMTFHELTHPDDRGWQAAFVETILEDRRPSWAIEKRYIRKDGGIIWVMVWGAFLKDEDGRVVRSVSTIVDVTNRKHAEELLKANQEEIKRAQKEAEHQKERLQSLLMAAPVPIAVLMGPQHRFWFVNEEYQKLTYDNDVLGKTVAEVFPGKQVAIISVLDRVYQTGECFIEKEVSFEWDCSGSGNVKRCYYDVSWIPIRDYYGRIEGIIGATVDVTEKVVMRADAERQVAELREERELRERFVNALTHDLRTPLYTINMTAQLLEKKRGQTEAVTDLSRRISDTVKRCDSMIQDLLDANRIRVGERMVVEAQDVDMGELLQTTVRDLSLMHGDRFITMVEGPCRGYWSMEGIRRVIENLSNNAVKYGASDKPITIGLKGFSDKVILSVHNHGSPMSRYEKSRLFTHFRRAKSAERSGKAGWGIGLTIVKGLVDAHHGEIAVKSTLGEGTMFCVTLPRDIRP